MTKSRVSAPASRASADLVEHFQSMVVDFNHPVIRQFAQHAADMFVGQPKCIANHDLRDGQVNAVFALAKVGALGPAGELHNQRGNALAGTPASKAGHVLVSPHLAV